MHPEFNCYFLINIVAQSTSSSRGGCYYMKEKVFGRKMGFHKPHFAEQENEDISFEGMSTCEWVSPPPTLLRDLRG